MTHYTKANEGFRQDVELKKAIYYELVDELSKYSESAEYLQKVYDFAVINRSEILRLLHKAIWNRNFLQRVLSKYPEDDTYIGNKAAFMTYEQAEALKEKYRDTVG